MRKISTILTALASCALILGGCDSSPEEPVPPPITEQPTGELEAGELPDVGEYVITGDKVTVNGNELYELAVGVAADDGIHGVVIGFYSSDTLGGYAVALTAIDKEDPIARTSLDALYIYTDGDYRSNVNMALSAANATVATTEGIHYYYNASELTAAQLRQVQGAEELTAVLFKNNTIVALFPLPITLKDYIRHVLQ